MTINSSSWWCSNAYWYLFNYLRPEAFFYTPGRHRIDAFPGCQLISIFHCMGKDSTKWVWQYLIHLLVYCSLIGYIVLTHRCLKKGCWRNSTLTTEGRFGHVNPHGVAFYNALIDALLQRGISSTDICNGHYFEDIYRVLNYILNRHRTICDDISFWHSIWTGQAIWWMVEPWNSVCPFLYLW
jgi:hypothetical protein